MSKPSIEKTPRVINGDTRDVLRISFGGRVVEAVEMDMADQWDFMEIAGRQLDNEPWVNTAVLACSVISIDGVPIPRGARTRDDVRRILRKLGEDGVDALEAAFTRPAAAAADTDALEAAAGN